MDSARPVRLVAAIAGSAALIGMGALSACSSGEKNEAPETTTTTTSEVTTTTAATPTGAPSESPAGPSAEPTEKSLDPRGGNQFTPGNTAHPAPTVPPGQHHPPAVGG